MIRLIGIYGGTFDPIHFGHLRPAVELCEALGLEEVRLIPAGVPPHRGQPCAPAADRLQMVRLAVGDEPSLVVDDREVRRDGPSYTLDTLRSLREEASGAALCLILGLDAFLGLDTWHQWRQLPELAHLVVAHRPGWSADSSKMSPALRQLFLARRADNADQLREAPAGRVILQAVSQLEISSTSIREAAAKGRSLRYLTPDPVVAYIREHGLYT